MFVGLVLALASAVATSAAFLFKQRGAVAAPAVDGRHPLRSAADLFRSRWWTIGWLVALGAWLLHVGALALAPLSIVQAVLSGGLVFLAVLAERFFGFHFGRRQWIGLVITATGLVVVGLTSGEAPQRELVIGRPDRGRVRGVGERCPARSRLGQARQHAPQRGHDARRRRGRPVRRLRRSGQVPDALSPGRRVGARQSLAARQRCSRWSSRSTPPRAASSSARD